jgi:hypothetical protein
MTVVTMALAAPGFAGDPKLAFTDPAEAGPDFAVQGEYAGSVQADEGQERWGLQVVALGDGKFQAVGYPGGLPGAGWEGGEKVTAEGETSGGVTRISPPGPDQVTVAIAEGAAKVLSPDGTVLGKLEKVHRESPTLGAKPPAGAVVLFDGTTADQFQGGRMTDDGLLMEGATSKEKFQSFTIHLEFRTPFQPYARGQARGNSGFYAQGRYETQILDSFGLEGLDNECGGIYKVGSPKVNMCLPPLSWQTYDADFKAAEFKDGEKVKNARVTVRHNGVVIQDDIEVPNTTTAAPVREEGPEPGPVFLQNHGNPVRFRNIWVVPK